MAGDQRFEVTGRCKVHLALPGRTKITSSDYEHFQVGPVNIGGWKFANVEELQHHIFEMRGRYTAQAVGRPQRLSKEDEELMRDVFGHHPNAGEKMEGMQYIQLGPNTKSDRPGDSWLV